MNTTALVMLVGTVLAAAPSVSAQAAPPDGKALFEKNCAACHGVQGIPSAVMADKMKVPKLDSGFVAARPGDSLANAIVGGKKHVTLKGKLSSEQVAAIAGYVRTLSKGAKG